MVRRLLIAMLGLALLAVAIGCGGGGKTEAGSSAQKGTVKIIGDKS
ncbi:MAG: hypothetical protein AB1599_01865 [Planctomycetota bacterium]